MAANSGLTAAFKLGTHTVLYCDKISFKDGDGVVIQDVPGFLQTYRERIAVGLEVLDFTASGTIDNSDTNGQLALRTAARGKTSVTANIYETTTYYHTITAYIEGFQVDLNPEGKGNWSCTGKSTGTVTHTAS